MNQVIISGRLVRDCTPNYTERGFCFTRFTVAVQRPKRKDGSEQTESCDFIDCIAFGVIAENIANNLHKGNKIFLQGKIHTGSYTNKENKKIFTHDIVVNSFEYLEPKNADAKASGSWDDFGAVEDLEF